ncbi:MAG: response regulator [Campylobacterales bacterium]|nr:response regulator [Campylobacterales bacterium]
MAETTLLQQLIPYCKTLKVLYVEDHKENQLASMPLFEDIFGRVITADSGKEGFSCYINEHSDTGCYFDLVITDIQMPQINGIHMIESIYKINPDQKTLILSAYQNEEYLIPLINLTVNGFIKKPLMLDEILCQLHKIFKKELERGEYTFAQSYRYDAQNKRLFNAEQEIMLTQNETKLLDLFLNNTQQYLSVEQIFDHLFFDNPLKDFSSHSIHGILKRFKSKMPENFIVNNKTLGYKINESLYPHQ